MMTRDEVERVYDAAVEPDDGKHVLGLLAVATESARRAREEERAAVVAHLTRKAKHMRDGKRSLDMADALQEAANILKAGDHLHHTPTEATR